jgi:hypothetical protein
VTHELKSRVTQEVRDVPLGAGEQIVHAQHFVTCFNEPVDEMGSEKPGATCDQYAALRKISTSHLELSNEWSRCKAALQVGKEQYAALSKMGQGAMPGALRVRTPIATVE